MQEVPEHLFDVWPLIQHQQDPKEEEEEEKAEAHQQDRHSRLREKPAGSQEAFTTKLS